MESDAIISHQLLRYTQNLDSNKNKLQLQNGYNYQAKYLKNKNIDESKKT